MQTNDVIQVLRGSILKHQEELAKLKTGCRALYAMAGEPSTAATTALSSHQAKARRLAFDNVSERAA
jgi:hypothetical protein